mmetsp:Transcript_3829/g.11045  ORF Transcript_3829/g.11045 Transcript_3829/m.11045 type:complete len:614 (-) Transcript_3829:249-2090(-)
MATYDPDASARVIQDAWRVKAGARLEQRNSAAHKIQTTWKGKAVPERMVLRIQRMWRILTLRRNFRRLLVFGEAAIAAWPAVSTIQRCWRASRLRRRWYGILEALDDRFLTEEMAVDAKGTAWYSPAMMLRRERLWRDPGVRAALERAWQAVVAAVPHAKNADVDFLNWAQYAEMSRKLYLKLMRRNDPREAFLLARIDWERDTRDWPDPSTPLNERLLGREEFYKSWFELADINTDAMDENTYRGYIEETVDMVVDVHPKTGKPSLRSDYEVMNMVARGGAAAGLSETRQKWMRAQTYVPLPKSRYEQPTASTRAYLLARNEARPVQTTSPGIWGVLNDVLPPSTASPQPAHPSPMVRSPSNAGNNLTPLFKRASSSHMRGLPPLDQSPEAAPSHSPEPIHSHVHEPPRVTSQPFTPKSMHKSASSPLTAPAEHSPLTGDPSLKPTDVYARLQQGNRLPARRASRDQLETTPSRPKTSSSSLAVRDDTQRSASEDRPASNRKKPAHLPAINSTPPVPDVVNRLFDPRPRHLRSRSSSLASIDLPARRPTASTVSLARRNSARPLAVAAPQHDAVRAQAVASPTNGIRVTGRHSFAVHPLPFQQRKPGPPFGV